MAWSESGSTSTSREVRSCAATGDTADLMRRANWELVYDIRPNATLADLLTLLLRADPDLARIAGLGQALLSAFQNRPQVPVMVDESSHFLVGGLDLSTRIAPVFATYSFNVRCPRSAIACPI
jgi:hypothetical protein